MIADMAQEDEGELVYGHGDLHISLGIEEEKDEGSNDKIIALAAMIRGIAGPDTLFSDQASVYLTTLIPQPF